MKKLLALSIALSVMVGCAYIAPIKTSQQERQEMVEQRHKEIDEAFTRGDITEIQRQELKNEALKAIRAGGD
jgi:uncharacterized protein YcfL